MSIVRKVLLKAQWTRPLPQLRILRTYNVALTRQPKLFLWYVLKGRETTNFTYDIANTDELVEFVATALQRPVPEIAGYAREVEEDAAFHRELSTRLTWRKDRNREPLFGRRIGWYCLVRALEPRLVVETGTADGLGTALLARAIQRNATEGVSGRLISFDVDSAAGWLLTDELLSVAQLVTGDTQSSMAREIGGARVDLFVHDSLHTYEHERMELETVLGHSSGRIVLVSDNAHATAALLDVAHSEGAEYSFFRERPANHFYPGAGIGLAIVERPALDGGNVS